MKLVVERVARWQHLLDTNSLGLRIGNKTIFRLLCPTVKFGKEKQVVFSLSSRISAIK